MSTFLTNIDLKGNQLLNVALQNLAVAPASPKEGQIYFDTAEKAVKVYAGGSWQAVGASTGASELTAEAMAAYVRDNQEAFEGHVTGVLTSSDLTRILDDWAGGRAGEIFVSEALHSALVNGAQDHLISELKATVLDDEAKQGLGQELAPVLEEKLKAPGGVIPTLQAGLEAKAQELAQAEVAKLVEAAPEELNTFQEIAEAIKENKEALAQIANTARVHTQELNFGAGATQEVAHNLGRRFVSVSLYDSLGHQVLADVRLVSETRAEVTVAESFTETLTAVVVG